MEKQLSVADELVKLADLLKDGLITQEEFGQQKKKLLGSSGATSSFQEEPAIISSHLRPFAKEASRYKSVGLSRDVALEKLVASGCGTEDAEHVVAHVYANHETSKKPMGGLAKFILIVSGLVVAFLLFGAIVGNAPEGNDKLARRRAIDLCWEIQAKKSLEPGTARYQAEVCEGLENEFQRKYGYKP